MADIIDTEVSTETSIDPKDFVHRSTLAKQGAEWKSKYDSLNQTLVDYDNKVKDYDTRYKDLEQKYKDLEQNHRATVEDYTWTSALSSTPLKFDDEDVQSVTLQTLKQKYKKAAPTGEVKLSDWLSEHLASEPSYLKPFIPAKDEEKKEARKPSPKPGSNGPSFEARKKEIAAMPEGDAKARAINKLMAEMKSRG